MSLMDRSLVLLSRAIGRVLLLVLLCTSMSYAQRSTYPKSFWIGVRGGVTASQHIFNPRVSQSIHTGIMGGLALRYDIEKGASLQAEVNCLTTGWRERYTDADLGYMRSLRYIELPLLTQLYFEFAPVRLLLNLGPVIGYNLADSSEVIGSNFTAIQKQRHLLPISNKLFWGMAGGPGVSVRLADRHRIEVDARLTYSFSDIWGNRRIDPYGQSAQLRAQATLSYWFRF